MSPNNIAEFYQVILDMTESTRFKKIHALISEDFYNELSSKKMFNSDWDSFIAEAIKEKLERDGLP